jgi:hypothetical protein
MNKTILSIIALISLSTPASASEPSHEHADDVAAGAQEQGSAEAKSGDELLITLRVPLMSPLFSETPVAVVDEEPITMGELTESIASMHSGTLEGSTSARKSYANLLERIITTKLIVQEARNIGFDEMPEFVSLVEGFSTKFLVTSLILPQLETVEPDKELVDELYREMSRELLLTTLKFRREEDAVAFEKEYDSSSDFEATASRFIGEGRADGEIENKQYMKLKDLLPEIAKKAYEMDVDSVSPIFSVADGFIVFHLQDARFYEDPTMREEARKKFLKPLQKKAADDYIGALIEKHSTVDEKLLKEVDFDWTETGFLWSRKQQPVDFEKLRNDQRVLATVHADEPFTVTVADIANEVGERHFHGLDNAAKKQKLNPEKRRVLRSILFEKSAIIEAAALGKDRDPEYLEAIDEFTSANLFDTFVKRAIAPEVKIEEEEVKRYYREHPDEFSSPAMYRMNGLTFYKLGDAEKALVKLRRKADFKWVSANSTGQVDKKAALFDNKLLSLTALPEDLHRSVEGAREGDSVLYSGPEGHHHVIAITKVYPPQPESYDASRAGIARIVFDRKMAELLEDWGEKLREAYDSRIFIMETGERGN